MKDFKALCFSFNGFNLGEFYGGIGGKYGISESMSLFSSIAFHKYFLLPQSPPISG